MVSFQYFLGGGEKPNEETLQQIILLDQSYFPFPWSSNQWKELIGGENSFRYDLILAVGPQSREESSLKILGFSLLLNLPEEDLVHLLKILIVPASRGNGLATQFLSDIWTFLKVVEKGTKIFLEVENSNLSAINLYRRMGFLQVGVAKDFYGATRHGLRMLLEQKHKET